MYCVIKCIVQVNQARVKNTDLRHPSCTVVMYKRKSASPVLNVLKVLCQNRGSLKGRVQKLKNTKLMHCSCSANYKWMVIISAEGTSDCTVT